VNNIFDAIPESIDQEVFEQLAAGENVTIERIISKGQQSPETGWYDQETSEWVIVLQGEAILQFEDGGTLAMKAGDYINIAAHSRHRVQWTDPDIETVWLAVHYKE
jgi:cupin 2 domain-containing protein